MSQPLKRSAVEAFGENAADVKQKSKSQRRKERARQPSESTTSNSKQNGKAQSPSHVQPTDPKRVKALQIPNGTPAPAKIQTEKTSKPAASVTRDAPSNEEKKSQIGSKGKTQKAEKNPKTPRADMNAGATPTKVVDTKKGPTVSQVKQPSSGKTTNGTEKRPKDTGVEKNTTKPEKGKQEQKVSKKQVESTAAGKPSKKKQHKQKGQPQRDTSKWSLSVPAGGKFIDHDPILTLDEQFLILATTKDIQIYSTKSSLLVRTIPAGTTSPVVSYAQLPNASQHLVVGFENGTIKKFDWTTGERVWTKRLDNHIISVAPTSSTDEGDSFLVVLELEDKQTAITSLTVDFNGEQTGLRPMLSKSVLTGQVRFSAELGVAVVCTQNLILIGRLEGEGAEATLQWEEVTIPDRIVCFDARISAAPRKNPTAKKGITRPNVTVAAGLKSGEIHIYNDLLNRREEANALTPQRLHWHRVAPRAVKFSPDSKYLVSGGDETVLVMWQLDTNQKQVLPHLTSAILNISISAQGSAYVLRLSDNSTMVLSTSDLKPSANVSGLAIDAASVPFLPDSGVPARLHPQHSGQLLLAYSSQALTPGLKPSEKSLNMLQTYDITSGLQLYRQALARNLASTINVGGNGQIIHEPDVTHLDVTYDGKWLITVDQWSPNTSDLDQLYLSRGDNRSRALHTETFLRFWSTTSKPGENASTSPWELNTRIDQPATLEYSSGDGQPAILAIAVSPTRHQVAIADTANHLKIYSPKARVKGGLPVKDSNGQQLFSWTCDHDISFSEPSDSSSSRSAAVTLSNDGSVIAVTWATTSDARARVHFIEPRTGKAIASLPDIISAGQSHLAFCGQNLIALSSKLVVLDMVTMQSAVIFQSISDDFPNNRFDSAKSRLAVNIRSGVAAISLSERDVRKASHVFLYDVRSGVDASSSGAPQVTHKERISETVQVLLAEHEKGGFLIVDGEGRSSTLSPPGMNVISGTVGLKSSLEVSDSTDSVGKLENIFGSGRKGGNEVAVVPRGETNGVAGSRSLEDVFRFERSSDVPGPIDLFGRVVNVVGGVGA